LTLGLVDLSKNDETDGLFPLDTVVVLVDAGRFLSDISGVVTKLPSCAQYLGVYKPFRLELLTLGGPGIIIDL
jgi:hypothetical protein